MRYSTASHYPMDIYLGFAQVDVGLVDRFLERFSAGMGQIVEGFPAGMSGKDVVSRLRARVESGASETAYWSRGAGWLIVGIDVTLTADDGLILGLGCRELNVDRVLAQLADFRDGAIVVVQDEGPPPDTIDELRQLAASSPASSESPSSKRADSGRAEPPKTGSPMLQLFERVIDSRVPLRVVEVSMLTPAVVGSVRLYFDDYGIQISVNPDTDEIILQPTEQPPTGEGLAGCPFNLAVGKPVFSAWAATSDRGADDMVQICFGRDVADQHVVVQAQGVASGLMFWTVHPA